MDICWHVQIIEEAHNICYGPVYENWKRNISLKVYIFIPPYSNHFWLEDSFLVQTENKLNIRNILNSSTNCTIEVLINKIAR